MRKLLALGGCALLLAFGLVARAAHVHDSADHHVESRGLHLDHTHLDGGGGHDHGHDDRHVPHHVGDVLYLGAAVVLAQDSNLLPSPAIVAVAEAADPHPAVANHDAATPRQPKDPPRKHPTRPRAPPV